MNKIAILMPGQGTQYIGMGKALYENFDIAKQVFEEAGESLGFDLKELIFNGDIKELTLTKNVQPAILTTSIAFYKTYIQVYNIEPLYLAGHSLGEITALTCAESISLSDAVKIVAKRGSFMQEVANEVGEGAMAAISNVSVDVIQQECEKLQKQGKLVVISNYNSRNQIVISGLKEHVKEAVENLKKLSAIAITLRVNLPFHSPFMKSAAEKMRIELEKYNFAKPKYKIISNVTGEPYGDADIKELLTRQIVEPVQWIKTMDFIKQEKIDYVLEMGPGSILGSMLKMEENNIRVKSLDNPDDSNHYLEDLTNKKLFNKNYLISRILGIAVCTQNNNFNNDEYEEGVIKTYNKIKEISARLEAEEKVATDEEVSECLKLLKTIFTTKLTPKEEIDARLRQLENETLILLDNKI